MTYKQFVIKMTSIMVGIWIGGILIGYGLASRRCEDVLSKLEPQIQMSIDR